MFKYIITTFIALVFSFSSFANTSWDDILNAKKPSKLVNSSWYS